MRVLARVLRLIAAGLALSAAVPVCAAPEPAPVPWWQAFADPALDALMARIERDNTVIAGAVARLALARANARLGQASSAPQVGLGTSASYAAGPLINAAGGSGGLFTGALGATWEPDLLGRLAPSRRAGKAEVRAAEADVSAERLLVQVATARAWYATGALAEARAAAAQGLDLARRREAIGQRCLANGSCTAAQVDGLSRGRSAASDRLALVVRREAEARDALAYLLGEREAIAAPASLPPVAPIPAGLDAALVARRPDVAAARARLEAAQARQSAARRDWLPHFALTATGGSASVTLAGLLAGGAGSIGLGLLAGLPILDGGAHRARVAQADAGEDLAAVGLRDSLLAAYRDANDAIALDVEAQAALSEAETGRMLAQTAAARAARAAMRGSIATAELDAAESAEAEARFRLALARLGQLDARLRLVAALGGGW